MSAAVPRDESGFAAQLERHRAELRVHCYRMLGSFEDAEDLVQETFLRAWRARAGFGADGRFSVRAWLYRIATNACLDVLRGRPRRMLEAPGRRPTRTPRWVRPPTCPGSSPIPIGCSRPRRTTPEPPWSRARRSSSPSSPRSSTCRPASAPC